MTTFNELQHKIRIKIAETQAILKEREIIINPPTPQEFYDYMTGEIFSQDQTTLTDVLASPNLMLHEIIEISELKKLGKTIDTRVIVDSPRETIYCVHFTAMDVELDYLRSIDQTDEYKKRLQSHYKVLTSDPNLPEPMRPRAVGIWEKHSQPIT